MYNVGMDFSYNKIPWRIRSAIRKRAGMSRFQGGFVTSFETFEEMTEGLKTFFEKEGNFIYFVQKESD